MIMRVQYVLEPYFCFLSVSTSVPKNTAGQLQLPKHASLRMSKKIEVPKRVSLGPANRRNQKQLMFHCGGFASCYQKNARRQ